MVINLLLEGLLEEPVAEKLLHYCGHEKGTVYGKKGCGYIKNKARLFQHATGPDYGLLVLTDFMDSKAPCPPQAIRDYLRQITPPPNFLCRFAVRELESWLLADRFSFAAFLKIDMGNMSNAPDTLADPKQELVNLARRSKKSAVRNGIVPPSNHGGPVAPAYVPTMTDFIKNHWKVGEAINNSPSLERCVRRLKALQI